MSDQGSQSLTVASPPGPPPTPDMVWIPGGIFRMGSDRHYPEEAPVHEVSVDGFWMDPYTVTNRDFRRFVEATGYVTFSEKAPRAEDYPGARPEMLKPGSMVFKKAMGPVDLRDPHNWWDWVPGADWRHPRGPQSSLGGLARHPAVQIAFADAEAYARWSGKVLPTEAEWEFAARGGLDGAEFVWGDEFVPRGRAMCNWWQGEFPHENLLEDGYEWTAPVGSFPPNGFGLFDMAGNVWEWTTDWYQPHGEVVRPCCAIVNPLGGQEEQSYHRGTRQLRIPRKVMKGGSYLCAPNYCRRYRPAARMAQPIDTSTCHLGFRCIVRVKASG
jgi:formylglycine-generating enzyme required for sulfatase activity